MDVRVIADRGAPCGRGPSGGLAEPGGMFVSNTVLDHVRDRPPFVFEDLGQAAD